MKNKRAQMETMGLLVIVILVSLILFFALSIGLKNKQRTEPDKPAVTESQAVSNLGTTMLESTGPCSWTIRELLTDCAYTREIMCGGKTACDVANETMTKMLQLTLDKWGYDYRLNITTSTGASVIPIIVSGCEDASNSNTEITPFGTTHGSMKITITMCK